MPKVALASRFSLAIEYHREEAGRWLTDIRALPGVTAYGRTKKQATAAVQVLTLRLIANRLEHGEAIPVRWTCPSLPRRKPSLDWPSTKAKSGSSHRILHHPSWPVS